MAINKKILVISGDTLPLKGLPTTGAGLRAWGLGQGLIANGYDVQFAMPATAAKGVNYKENGEALIYEHLALDPFIKDVAPDFVILQHWVHARLMHKPFTYTIMDLHGPLILETLYQDNRTYRELMHQKLVTLRKGHYFTCAGERQRSYFYAWLLQAGIDVRQPCIDVIPFSLSPTLPVHDYPDALTFVYGGVFLPWQNPALGLRTLIKSMESRKQGHLKYYGGYHPWVKMKSIPLFEETRDLLIDSNYATISPPIPRDDLIDHYRNASVAWDVMTYNCERGMAFTSRTAEYLWAGLPVVQQKFSEIAGYIGDYEAGWLVDPEDEDEMRDVIEFIMDNPEEVIRRGKNAQLLAKEAFNWKVTISPLIDFIENPEEKSIKYLNDRPFFIDPEYQLPPAKNLIPLPWRIFSARWSRRILGTLKHNLRRAINLSRRVLRKLNIIPKK